MTTTSAKLPLGPGVPDQRQIGDHPMGLYALFFTEMWERFSYYGMRALLVYYMTKHIFLPDWKEKVLGHSAIMGFLSWIFGSMDVQAQSSQIYGLYTAFVYLTPIFGGMLADRYIGQRKSVYIGGVIMAAAQFTLMFESLFYVGLLMLIIGNGFFKPNISTQVGALYPQGDKRRDPAFMIFYVGINVGALMSPLICGTLGEKVGWSWGFGSAGVGMMLGLVIYGLGQRMLPPDNVMKRKSEMEEVEKDAGGGYRGGKVKDLKPAEKKPFTRDEWMRIGALCILCALNIVFWAVYEQQGNTLALWADHNTDRFLFGWEFPASWLQAVNPAFIFLFTPLIIGFWKKQAEKGTEPSTVAKMGIGCLILGLGYLLMALAALTTGGHNASVLWLIGTTVLLTLGELYLSPIGLSLVTKASPARIVSMMMGMWFMSSFFGNYLEGYLGTFWDKMPKTAYFVMLTSLAVVTAIAMFALSGPLKRALGEGAPSPDATKAKHEEPESPENGEAAQKADAADAAGEEAEAKA